MSICVAVVRTRTCVRADGCLCVDYAALHGVRNAERAHAHMRVCVFIICTRTDTVDRTHRALAPSNGNGEAGGSTTRKRVRVCAHALGMSELGFA